jgi:hypothetical protein
VDPQWEMIAFGLQGMFSMLEKKIIFLLEEGIQNEVLAICGKEECIVEIMFSSHPYDLRDLMLMRKLIIRRMVLLKMSLMDTCVIFLKMPVVMAL